EGDVTPHARPHSGDHSDQSFEQHPRFPLWLPGHERRVRVHGRSRSTDGSRGMPSACSPGLLRWTSSVPPPMREANWLRNWYCQNPSASASSDSIPSAPSRSSATPTLNAKLRVKKFLSSDPCSISS